MGKIQLTKEENQELKKIKTELLTDKNATPASNQACERKIAFIAKKYNVDSQIIWDSIK